MPVIANFTRWTSWIKASITTKEGCICINPTWKQNMIKVMRIPIPEKSLSDFIEIFELKQKPIAHQVYNIITNFQAVLEAGRTQVQFPDEIEAILSEANLANRSLADCLITYQSAFKIASSKLNKHVDIQKPALNFFKSARIFDIRQKASLSRNIVDYLNIPGFSSDIEFLNEWVVYMNAVYPLENFEIDKFWEGKKNELPLM